MADESLPTKRISELEKSDIVNDADIFPAATVHQGDVFDSRGVTVSTLRRQLNFDSGFFNIPDGINATLDGQVFHVFDSEKKLYVDEYINTMGEAVSTGNVFATQNLLFSLGRIVRQIDSPAGLSFSATDIDGQRLWLEANDGDGGPSEWSKTLLMHHLYNPLLNPSDIPGLSIALATQDRVRTWLEANDEDGGPSAWSKTLFMHHLYDVMLNPADILGLSVALAAKGGLRTWLEANDDDGGPSEWTLHHLRRCLDPVYMNTPGFLNTVFTARPESIPTAFSIKPTDVYSLNGEILPVACDMGKISGFGSSSLLKSGMVAKLTAMASDFDANYYDGGQGGEIAQHSSARLGSVMFQLSFPSNTIPASGSVIVTVRGLAGDSHQASQLKDFSGLAAGVAGTVSYNSTAGQFQFSRSVAGESLVIDGAVPFVPDDGPAWRSGVGLLWMGKNNAYAPLSDEILSDPLETFKCISASFDYFSALTKRVLVLGSFLDSNFIAQRVDDHINKCNALCAEKYGNLYVDVQSYLSGAQLWIDTGITPTQDDLNHQATGRKPPSISLDNGHLNDAGASAVVNNLIKPRLINLGWY